MIHSPPLLVGLSRIIPTSANSEQTRRTGRCRDIRAVSSFSRCSGVNDESADRAGGLNAEDINETTAGVKVLGNLRCNADITWRCG
jgi:hypothetical protein